MGIFDWFGKKKNAYQESDWIERIDMMMQLHQQKKYKEAAQIGEEVLKIAVQIWGEKHLNTAHSINWLAGMLYKQGKYSQAEPFYLSSLSIREKQLGADHPDTAQSLNSLANLYKCQGRYSEAEPLYLRSLSIREKQLGLDHPDTAQNLNSLAMLYKFQGRYSEAEHYFLRSLSIREKQLGLDHPDTAQSLNDLAMLYCNQGRYSEAESLYLKSLSVYERYLGVDHLHTGISLNNLAELYRTQGLNSKAEPYYLRSLSICEKQLGADHPDTATSLNNLAILYTSQGRYSEAEPLYLRSLSIKQKQLGANHPSTAISLNSLADLYRSQGRYSEAEPLFKRALSIREKHLGANHPDTASSLNSLADFYRSQGRYSEAEPLFKRALSIREKHLGVDHFDTAFSLSGLALVYESQGRYSEAESLHRRSLLIIEQQLGANAPNTATGLKNLAMLYESQGRYSEAEPLFKRSLLIIEQQLGADHPDAASSLNNLAILYKSQGRYSEAEPFFKRALSIREQQLGADHPDTASSLNDLAGLYYAQRRYDEVYPLCRRALSIREQQLGADHPDTASSLNTLALLYQSLGFYSEAEPFLLRSLAICEQQLGASHLHTASSLNNLASLYQSQGRYSEAESLFLRSLAIREQRLGTDHPDTESGFNNLAGLYSSQGRYSEAEPLYLRSLAICEQQLGVNHSHTASTLHNLAALYDSQGRYSESLNWRQKGLQGDQDWLDLVFPSASETERLGYLDQIQYRFDVFLSLIYQHFLPLPKDNAQRQAAMIAGLDTTLNRKAITLTTAAALSSALYSGRYPELEADFQQLRQLQAEKSRLYTQPYDDNTQAYKQQRLQEIDNQLRELEPKLAQAVPEFKLAHQTVDRQAISLKLPDDSTLIEFVRFRSYDSKKDRFGQARYVAFILKNPPLGEVAKPEGVQPQQQQGDLPTSSLSKEGNLEGIVEMVDLGDAEELDYLIQTFREQITDAPLLDDLAPRTKPRETQPTKKLQTPDRQPLIEKLLNPLKPYLNTSNLIFATDGLLNLLPFNLVGFEQTIRYLNSGRELLREDVHIDRPSTAPLILADPNFDYPHENALNDAPIFFDREHSRICKTLGESVAQKLRVIPYLDNQALSSRLLQTPSPRILLIATHGHYEETTVHIPAQPNLNSLSSLDSLRDNSPKDLPMYRSFLAMTGANTGLRGETLPPEAGNGLLSAQDITAVDLWNTNLVVLCACQTGMGDIKTGEGVFGLRRALAIAGAKTLIMSLWSVPALPTVLLMDRLFDELEQQSCKDYHAALKTAQDYIQTITVAELKQSQLGQDILKELSQKNLLNGNPDQQPLQHPHFWAAWICQGN